MDLSKVFRELKFLREDHPEEYKEYLSKVKPLDYQLPVLFPKLCKFYSVQGCVLQQLMLRGYYESQHFQARSNDIFVVSFPKTGTTWVQEAVYLIGTNGDFKKAKSTNLEKRFPLLELTDIDSKAKEGSYPRFIKSHLPYSLLPQSVKDKKCKIIYVTRNPKDTVVSMWHFYKLIKLLQYKGTLNEFLDNFLSDKLTYAPFARNVLEFWKMKDEDNILFLTYEELTKDIIQCIKRIADFLEKSLSETTIQQIAHHCSFQTMSTNSKVNFSQWKENGFASKETSEFMRKGKVGDWKNYFDESMNRKMDEYIERNFKNANVEFIYEL